MDRLRGGLIVSCQAAVEHPLCDPWVIGLVARCAQLGGAVAVRINGPDDIRATKRLVQVPVIGLHKLTRPGGRSYITPGIAFAIELAKAGADIVAVEATAESWVDPLALIAGIHDELGLPVMVDVSTVDEGLRAWDAGADLVASTLSGYTAYTAHTSNGGHPPGPDIELVAALNAKGVTTVAEGRYATAQQVTDAFAAGAWAVVVGTAITDPIAITRGFARVTPRHAQKAERR